MGLEPGLVERLRLIVVRCWCGFAWWVVAALGMCYVCRLLRSFACAIRSRVATVKVCEPDLANQSWRPPAYRRSFDAVLGRIKRFSGMLGGSSLVG